ncbi:MAG: aminotransferase class V-fold PLP-dependent enzyme [Acidimicrobiia bacterium]
MIEGRQRSLFDLPPGVSYLNCAFFSPQLKSVTTIGRESLTLRERPWQIQPGDMFAPVDDLRERFARLIDGDPAGVAVVPSVSYGVQTAADNAPLESGDEIVVLEDQFPSDLYPWMRAAARAGAEIVTVPRPSDWDWAAAVTAHIGRRTKVVAVPFCHWTDGSRVDLDLVGEAARAAGAWLVVDVSQALGAVSLSVTRLQPDWLVCAGYKYLFGPYRTCYMWVAPRHRDGTPLEETWMGRAGSEDFSRLVEYTNEYRGGAARFDSGEPIDFVTTPMAVAALDQVLAWDPDAVGAYVEPLTARVENLAVAAGFVAVPAGRRLPHLLGFRFPDGAPEGVVERLAEQRVFVSLRGSSVRVAPHVYNDGDDVDRLFAAIGR